MKEDIFTHEYLFKLIKKRELLELIAIVKLKLVMQKELEDCEMQKEQADPVIELTS